METNSLERFRKRQKIKNSYTVYSDVDENLVNEFLNSSLDIQKVDDTFNKVATFYDTSVSDDEAKEFLERFKKDFNQARFDKLITDCKKEVINSIVTPFGLGKIVAAYDKVGGNVDTIHNAREGIYVTEEEAVRFENRGDYNSDDYHKDINYIKINRQMSEQKKQGELKDYMTGEVINQNESYDLDHVVSANEIHNDAGRILAELNGTDLANTETNLRATTPTNNRSKKADTMNDFLERKVKNLENIKKLEEKESLTPQEENQLRKLKELQKIDDEKALKFDEEARKEINDKINKAYYSSGKFAKNTAITGATEGAKIGLQQALGIVIVEFFTAVFDEIIDIYKNGYSGNVEDDGFLNILKERLKRIGIRIKDKWKDVVVAFKDGFISGFISNLVTTFINVFFTTGKRLVRIIREGFFSLFKAIKILLFPPEGLTYEEALHEAKKILATGVIVGLGVIVEQYIDGLVKATIFLEPFADILTSIFIGSLTGLAVAMAVYHIDKKKNDKDAVKLLMQNTDKTYEEINNLLTFQHLN